MYRKNVSGQFFYFDLVSALSGNAVPGSSGNISGRKALDGLSGMIVLSGNIIELGGGAYRANLYDFDTNGDTGAYFFTASGCVPRLYTVAFDNNVSGRLNLQSGLVYPASGAFATVPSGTLFPASGGVWPSNTYTTDLGPRNAHQWDFSGADNVSGRRCALNAGRKLVNKWDLATSGYLSVYAEDDATLRLRQAVSEASGAAPIIALDTN